VDDLAALSPQTVLEALSAADQRPHLPSAIIRS
jgi:hypothetical protein